MDAELRTYLESMEERLGARMAAGDRETRVLVEAVHHDVRAVADGVSMLREEMHRRFEEQERNYQYPPQP